MIHLRASLEVQSDPVKRFALLFLHQEEANGGEEWNVEEVCLLLPMHSHYAFQQSLRLWGYQIRPQPVINGVLLDEAVDGASIRGEIGGVLV